MKHLFSIVLSVGLALAAADSPGAQSCVSTGPSSSLSTQIDLVGPPGSGQFGALVTALPNGNIVVVDPYYDSATATDVGAVYLYDGDSGALLSKLTGSKTDDRVGISGVAVLSNGHYVVRSRHWTNGTAESAGAVTWCSGALGCTGPVNATNSLVGSTAFDFVGDDDVTELSNGSYVVRSLWWDNGGLENAGAVTWCSGTTGCTGVVTTTNSLVGSTAFDLVGDDGVTELSNGSYVVCSYRWNNGGVESAGAVTWCSGTTGCTGTITATNSLVGSSTYDRIGYRDVITLSDGSYLVISTDWDNGPIVDAGSVTWCSGTTGCTGPITVTNSLVGSQGFDNVGALGVTALSNGSYVVQSPLWNNGDVENAGAVTWCSDMATCTGVVTTTNSLVGSSTDDLVGYWVVTLSHGDHVLVSPYWDNGDMTDAGAVTWCSDTTGCTGMITVTNSLVGSTANDRVGSYNVTALNNGNYVVVSPDWTNGTAAKAGAVTWCSGAEGCTGTISAANSLVGITINDWVGYQGVTELNGGDYVVHSDYWDNGAIVDAGAVTWCSGTGGCTGPVTAANSLAGSSANDQVGHRRATPLSSGDYVVYSSEWDNGTIANAGAATWCNGTAGCTGPISPANSLVGSQVNDQVGFCGVTALRNGGYLVCSTGWDNGAIEDAGAVTWCSGSGDCIGPISEANSLVGTTADDQVGYRMTTLNDGNYVVRSYYWDNGTIEDAGAVTRCSGTGGCTGPVTVTNSLVGSTANDLIGFYDVVALSDSSYAMRNPHWNNDAGAITWCIGPMGCTGPITTSNSVLGTAMGGGNSLVFAYDPVNLQLVVGRPADNTVTLFRPYRQVFVPLVLG